MSDSPKGPFRPVGNRPVTPEGWHCLDGTLYTDRKGAPWLVFCHEWLQVGDGQICAVPLSEDLSEAVGEPVIHWYNHIGGAGSPYAYKTACVEEPCFRLDPRGE